MSLSKQLQPLKKSSTIYIPYIPFLLLFILILLMHWNISPSGDDLTYLDNANRGIISSSIRHYKIWSSRTIVEATMMIILKTKYGIWKVANSFMFTLLAYSISSLFGGIKTTRNNIFVCGLVLLFPLNYLNEAGWCASTTNYWWPLALGVFSLHAIKYTFDNKRISIGRHILYLGALIYSANVEQYTAALLAIYIISFILYYIQNKRLPKQLIPYLLFLFISLAYIFLCPGNDQRYLNELNSRFPEFATIPFIQKVSMGLGATLYQLIWGEIFIFGLCCILITILLFKKNHRLWPSALFVSCISLLKNIWFEKYPDLQGLSSLNGGYSDYPLGSITIENFSNPTSYIPFALFGGLILLIMICLVFSFSDIKKGYFALGLFILSIGIRCIMCFTPTIWASGYRTFIPTIGFLFAIGYMLFTELDTATSDKKIIYSILALTLMVALLSTLNMTCSIMMD